jgi:transcriptional regulator with XRE-family HTH domain
MNIFAERIKTLRKEHKLSQKQLGEIIGISKCGIWEIEQGENKTNLDRIMVLADYFDVSWIISAEEPIIPN